MSNGRRVSLIRFTRQRIRRVTAAVGARLRINAQLVDTHTDFPLWSERYDREMKDVFEVQDEIARSIAEALRITLTPQEQEALAAKPTENLQAYDLSAGPQLRAPPDAATTSRKRSPTCSSTGRRSDLRSRWRRFAKSGAAGASPSTRSITTRASAVSSG